MEALSEEALGGAGVQISFNNQSADDHEMGLVKNL